MKTVLPNLMNALRMATCPLHRHTTLGLRRGVVFDGKFSVSIIASTSISHRIIISIIMTKARKMRVW